MDGLSAAASGIAVVSLAIQLVDSIRQIKQFLHDVSDAPKELTRLQDLLDLLEMILQNTKEMIETQRRTSWQADIDVSPSIFKAIKNCERKLQILVEVIDASKKASASNGKVARSLGSFKLAFKKKDIERFETQLDQAINLLNTAITLTLHTAHSNGVARMIEGFALVKDHVTATYTKEIAMNINSENEIADRNLEDMKDGATICVSRSGRTDVSRRTQSTTKSTTYYHGLLGKLIFRRTCRPAVYGRDNVLDHDQSSWVFTPSFLSRCLELQFASSFGTIEKSLRVRPVLSWDHPIWAMCQFGDIDDMRELFCRREVSPFSVSLSGETLLHRATHSVRIEVCELLLQFGSKSEERDNYGNLPSILEVQKDQTLEHTASLHTLLFPSSEGADFAFFHQSLFLGEGKDFPRTVSQFKKLVFKRVNRRNIDFFNPSPIWKAMDMMQRDGYCHYQEWRDVIQYLIVALGADVSKCTSRITLLDEIIDNAETPFESRELGARWLDILVYSKVDISKYLQDEGLGVPNRWRLTNKRPLRRRLIFEDGKIPMIFWDWFIDPNAVASEVAYEFGHLGPKSIEWRTLSTQRSELLYWPYMYPTYKSRVSPVNYQNWRAYIENRYKHRQHKKDMKLARANKIKGTRKIPGAWID